MSEKVHLSVEEFRRLVQTSPIQPGRFSCPVCSKRFPSMGEKKRHLRQEHPRNVPRKDE